MRERLLELIPEFNEIKDKELLDKCINVWIKAFKYVDMTPDDLLEMPFTLFYKTDINFIMHMRGVIGMTMAAGRKVQEIYPDNITIDLDILAAGAVLHDVAKMLEMEKTDSGWAKTSQGQILRHPFSGVGLCFDEGIPDEVMHIIAAHSKEGDNGKRTPEAWLLHHSDFMNFDIFK